jgi:tripartite-type tricarboxylate transporter receptor subunit TctC
MHISKLLGKVAIALTTCAFSFNGIAANNEIIDPSRPIKLVVGYSAGGSSDILARLVADQLRTTAGLTVVVENKPGAVGLIASQTVKKAIPDGTTLLLQPMAPIVLSSQIYKGQKIDSRKDFAPISEIATMTFAIAVDFKSGPTDIAGLELNAKKAAKGAQFANPGIGGLGHLIGAQMTQLKRLDWTPVPYKNSLSYLPELASGQIIAAVDGTPELLPLHQSQNVRIIATSGPERTPSLPNVPTLREQGYQSAEALNWFALFGPAGMKPELVNHLNQVISKAMSTPDAIQKLKTLGFEPNLSSPEKLGDLVKADYEKWGRNIQNLGISVE